MPTSSCREVTRKLASDELCGAGPWTRASVRIHLLMCRHCRRYARQLRNMRHAARTLWADDVEDVSGELENRIIDDLFAKEDSSHRAE